MMMLLNKLSNRPSLWSSVIRHTEEEQQCQREKRAKVFRQSQELRSLGLLETKATSQSPTLDFPSSCGQKEEAQTSKQRKKESAMHMPATGSSSSM